jgi:glyoxylase-like metal-dependent hydrolase (beta-lactamase superfamily II)
VGGVFLLEHLGLQLIRIDLPFRLDHVNCFLAEGENGWTLIDTGLHDEPTINRWKEELEGKEVTDILITHYHPDHFGYAGGLQRKLNARVSMSKIDTRSGLSSWQEPFLNKLMDHYMLAGIPKTIAEGMTENTRSFVPRVTPYPNVDHYFEEGEKIQLGKYEYEVIFTPGHSDGLVCFYNKDQSTLLSTDHILPKITPNISYWFHGDDNPLQTYMASLNKMKKLDADFVIPSHGQPFYDANERIEQILQHHEERLDYLLGIIKKETRLSVFEASEKLFNKKLNIHETRFAVGETLAHLEYLRKEGQCTRELEDGEYSYSV